MFAGAAVSTVNLIILLAVIGDIKAYHAVLGHRLTAAQVSQLNTPFITLAIGSDLVPIALWLWMGAGERPGPELGTQPVHGAVRPGDAGPGRRLRDAGDSCQLRPDAVRPDPPRADLAGRSRRGVAAVAPASSAFFKPQSFVRVPPARPRLPGRPPRLL
jgi:hypothetical protein